MRKKMKNKLIILAVLIIAVSSQSIFSQSLRPLGITIEAKANFDNPEWRWTPVIGFRLLGPVNSGSQITVDFTLPNGSPFVTLKCDMPRIDEGSSSRIGGCGFNNPDAAKATNLQGLFGFQIKLDSKVLYSGKFNVSRILYNPDGTPAKNKQFYYFVDNDWRLNFAYVGTFFGDTSNNIYTEFWIKNRIQNKADFSAQLFYNGKQIAETSPSFVLESYPKENQKQEYTNIGLNFPALMTEPEAVGFDDYFRVFKNPGDYEIKLVREGKPARSIKFSVGRDGKLVPNGVGTDLIGGGIIVPNQILGDTDGVFNKLAWKEGVWGNPIKNLLVP
jgi:hypothetical protein